MIEIVSILVLLLILSLITERITHLILLCLPYLMRIFPLATERSRKKKKAHLKQNTEKILRSAEDLTFLTSLAAGFLIALFTNTGIFNLMQIEALGTYRFYPVSFIQVFTASYLCGCLLTGFLLSYCSVLFQSISGLLLESKRFKKKSNEPELYDAAKVMQLNKALHFTPREYADMAFRLYEKDILRIPNVSWAVVAEDETMEGEQYVVNIYLKDNHVELIPTVLPVTLPEGTIYPVRTRILPGRGVIKAHSCLSPGLGIGNINLDTSGTLGCLLYDDQQCLSILTCYHVVQGGLPDTFNERDAADPVTIVDRTNGNLTVGNLSFGRINEFLDMAIIKNLNGNDFDPVLSCNGMKISGPRIIDSSVKNTRVSFRGYLSHCSTGTVVRLGANISDVVFDDGRKRNFSDVIVLQNDNSTISQKGDSGSVAVDPQGRAVGLIFAGDDFNTFAIRMDRIINYLGIYSFA